MAPAPADAGEDARGIRFISLDVVTRLSSRFWLEWEPCREKAVEALELRSWQQLPPGTIPNDDRQLANLSEAGERWPEWREWVLSHGWEPTADGTRFQNRLVRFAVTQLIALKRRAEDRSNGGVDTNRLDAKRRAALESLARAFGRTQS